MGEDFRVKYIKSLNNVLKQHGWEGTNTISQEDSSNLNQCIGCLYSLIKQDGEMTKELAEELECECLWKEA